MKILIVSQFFPPESGATQSRLYEFASFLVAKGHQVTVITEFPNHPSGRIRPGYRFKLFEREELCGIDVIRCPVLAFQKKNSLKRILFYLSFALSSVIVGLLCIRRGYDIVYTTSPPFFTGIAGLALAFFKGGNFVFEVRDLWPDSAVALGELRNTILLNASLKLESLYYRKSKLVVAVTEGIHKNLITEKGVDEDRSIIVMNGTNPEKFRKIDSDLKARLGLGDKFIIGYAGNFGIAQGMENICQLAKSTSERPDLQDIHFLLIGEGPRKSMVMDFKIGNNLSNMTVVDERQMEEIPKYISIFDAALVPLKKCMIFEGALPTKLFDCMACEIPVIVSINGEAERLVNKFNCGIAVPAEDIEGILSAAIRLRSSPALRKEMGGNGRNAAVRHFSRIRQNDKLEKRLAALGPAKK